MTGSLNNINDRLRRLGIKLGNLGKMVMQRDIDDPFWRSDWEAKRRMRAIKFDGFPPWQGD